MNSSAVQKERGPRRPSSGKVVSIKTANGSAFRAVHCRRPTIRGNLLAPGVHEMAAQIFLLSVRSARQNLVLVGLPRYTQDLVLCHTWSQLFLLHSISWSLPLPSAECAPDVCRLLLACHDLRLDSVETNLLETILLCRHDVRPVSELLGDQMLVQCERAQLALSRYSGLGRYSVLLLVLPALLGVSATSLRSLLLDPIVGAVPIEHVIAVI